MSTDKPFRKIKDLVAALATAEQGIVDGTLKLDGLEVACGEARELFERLIVLRHKARESVVAGGSGVVKEPVPVEQELHEESVVEPEEVSPAPSIEGSALRLDTRPMEVSPRQTSLIEAIEHTELEKEAPKKEAPATPRTKDKPSVAEKLEKAAVKDLGKAISLSHKFWFVAELFNGDRINYERSVESLNNMKGLKEAKGYVEQEVLAKLKKPADPEAVSTFNELIERRYA